MNSLRNKVQLIGNLGNDPEIINGYAMAQYRGMGKVGRNNGGFSLQGQRSNDRR